MLADWYQPNVGTPYEVSPMPWLYNKYVGHDNNRDSYMAQPGRDAEHHPARQPEWFPEILYNQHQTAPSRRGSSFRRRPSRPTPTSTRCSSGGRT